MLLHLGYPIGERWLHYQPTTAVAQPKYPVKEGSWNSKDVDVENRLTIFVEQSTAGLRIHPWTTPLMRDGVVQLE
jgi:hypothetical protein